MTTAGWNDRSVPDETHVLHWNGSTWTTAKIIKLGEGLPYSISVSAPDNVWVIGFRASSTTEAPWVWHFDGTKWTRMRLPIGDGEYLNGGILALGSYDTWVGGTNVTNGRSTTETILLHWNGTGWVPADLSGLPHSGIGELEGASSTGVWASTAVPNGER